MYIIVGAPTGTVPGIHRQCASGTCLFNGEELYPGLKWRDLGLDVEDLYAFDRALGRDVEDLLCITVVCGRYNLYEVAVLLSNFVSVQMHRIWLWRGRELLLL